MDHLLYKIKATVAVVLYMCDTMHVHLMKEYYNDCMLLVLNAVSGKNGI